MADIILYGLKTCDTCRKAVGDLKAAKKSVVFHDVRDEGVTKKQLEAWAGAVGWEKLLNKASTTWRSLPDADKADVGKAKAIRLMADNPTLIKRPVIERGPTQVFVGWSADVQKAVL
ncbi:MAG: ArsC/Spx/MgsR family protein [Pseudomonadota bacterium]|nr:ArsC/Spx/MgsR family protein [Pseudomonadota bacterium]